MSTRAFRNKPTGRNTFYPHLLGTRGAVACQHYLAADAAAGILKAGGNAVDAAVAGVLVEGLVNPQMHTLGGECPMLIRMANGDRVHAINGNTAAPQGATAKAFRRRGCIQVPDEGILAAGVPAALGALVIALRHFGQMTFGEVAAPALYLARQGFPIHRGLLFQEKFGVIDLVEKFRSWAGSAHLYLPNGTVPREGDILKNPAFAATLEQLSLAEKKTAGARSAGLDAVYEEFYRGDIAAEIASYAKSQDGFLARIDLASFDTLIEAPASIEFRDTTLFKCGFWTQGPTMLQAISILDQFDLGSMAHNSAEYIHLLIESIKLSYADREQYYADPRQIDVPEAELVSKEYGAQRAGLIDATRADLELRPGDPRRAKAVLPVEERLGGRAWGPGTVHVDVIDAAGNMVAATPSGAWIRSAEVIPTLGFPLGNRLMTFYLDPPHHPNRVAPFKRPRTTISPSLAYHSGRPWMVFGSMGGDQQDQWQLQFFLNRAVFGMTIQEAIEAPKFSSEHFPGFFAPHDRFPTRVRVEPRIGEEAIDALSALGHEVEVGAEWTEGYLLAAGRESDTGTLTAGCDPRGAKGEVFPACALCW